MKSSARIGLEQPHLGENRRSVERAMAKGVQPRSLHGYVLWFLEEWSAESVMALHGGGVWRSRKAALDREGQPTEKIPTEHIGGSRLGTPQYADAFRRLLENSPFETDEEGYFVRPVRAAIAKMCGRGGWTDVTEKPIETHKLQPAPFMARFLFRLALTADLDIAAQSMGLVPQAQAIYAEQALYRLWKAYEVGPGAMGRVA